MASMQEVAQQPLSLFAALDPSQQPPDFCDRFLEAVLAARGHAAPAVRSLLWRSLTADVKTVNARLLGAVAGCASVVVADTGEVRTPGSIAKRYLDRLPYFSAQIPR